MSKAQRTGPVAVDNVAQDEAPAAQAQTKDNFQLTYRREHPGNRCSYGIAGVPGIVVFDRGLFADPSFTGNITLDVALAQPKADTSTKKAEREAAKALKLAERAQKAEARIAAAAAKAEERKQKAEQALAAARAKAEAATASKSADPAAAQS